MSTIGLLTRINTLPEVKIGTQVWMSKNYDFGGFYPNGAEANITDYGKLYTWGEAMAIDYPGWHLPTTAEYLTLSTYLGGLSVSGGHMKSSGTDYWISPNTGADNSSGLSIRAAGIYEPSSGYYYFQYQAWIWTSTSSGIYADAVALSYDSAGFFVNSPDYTSNTRCSVRLIKNS